MLQDLLARLKTRDLAAAANEIAKPTGIHLQPSGPGDLVTRIYPQQLDLTLGRFAMIDNLGHRLGHALAGKTTHGGGVEWSFARSKSIGR